MNLRNLQKFQELSQQVEEISIFKEYLEKLFNHVDNENAEAYWEDFLDISKTMIETFAKLGHSSLNNDLNVRLENVKVTEEVFKSVITELYNLSVQHIKAYYESIRYCSLCKEKVVYLPLPEEYNECIKRYQVPISRPETLNREEYICPICYSLDRKIM